MAGAGGLYTAVPQAHNTIRIAAVEAAHSAGKGVFMKFRRLPVILVTLSSATAFAQGWPQWGQNPQHSGSIPVLGQSPNTKLASHVYDPFVAQEQAENGGELLAHYQ